MPKVSVIVPVYNVEKYLEKCLDSLVNQTLKDIEIIVVNDGSPDKSQEIIAKYAKKYRQIKPYIKENGGLSDARNFGLKKAAGEYIAFVDSDDYVDINMYEKMYNKAIKEDLDIVMCNYSFAYSNRVEPNINSYILGAEQFITKEEYIMLTPCAWNKLIKRSFLERQNFSFPKGIIYEDLASMPTLSLGNPKIIYLNECFYYYVQSDSSITRNNEYKKKYEDIFESIKYLYEKMKDKGYEKQLEYLVTYHLLYLASLNFYKYKKYKNIDKVANEMRKYFPKWYKNKLIREKFSKKKIFYMKLFYYKKYFLINLYRRLLARNDNI